MPSLSATCAIGFRVAARAISMSDGMGVPSLDCGLGARPPAVAVRVTGRAGSRPRTAAHCASNRSEMRVDFYEVADKILLSIRKGWSPRLTRADGGTLRKIRLPVGRLRPEIHAVISGRRRRAQ